MVKMKKVKKIFEEVREAFPEVKEMVSLVYPHFSFHLLDNFTVYLAVSGTLEDFREELGREPELIVPSKIRRYGISVLPYIEDENVIRALISHEFGEILLRETHPSYRLLDDEEREVLADKLACERGFGKELSYLFTKELEKDSPSLDKKFLRERLAILCHQ